MASFAGNPCRSVVWCCGWLTVASSSWLCGLLPSLFTLFQAGLDTKVQKSRKQIKERKNRSKKIRGVKKVRGAPNGVHCLRCPVLYCCCAALSL